MHKFVTAYAGNKELREGLNNFSQEIFGITVLKEDDVHYVPFSYVLDNKIIANISVGRFHQMVNGIHQEAYMIQTVGTLPEYRNRGLIRELFVHAEEFINSRSGITFFWASNSKETFYKQFGYSVSKLVSHFESAPPQVTEFKPGLQAVDITDTEQRKKLTGYVENRKSISQVFGNHELSWLFLWYCDQEFSTDIYFLKALDVYIVYKIEDDALVLFDVVGRNLPTIEQLYPYLGTPDIKKVKYIFNPDLLVESYLAIPDEESMFFTKGAFKSPSSPFTIPMMARGSLVVVSTTVIVDSRLRTLKDRFV